MCSSDLQKEREDRSRMEEVEMMRKENLELKERLVSLGQPLTLAPSHPLVSLGQPLTMAPSPTSTTTAQNLSHNATQNLKPDGEVSVEGGGGGRGQAWWVA